MGDVDCELDCGDIGCGECLSVCCSSALDGGGGYGGGGGGAWPCYSYHHHHHNSGGESCTCTCFCCCLLLVILAVLLVLPYVVVYPMHVSVQDASLARLAPAWPNGTALAYDVSLAVALHNRNSGSLAKPGAVDAELRFAGARIAGFRMQGQESSSGIQPGKTEVYHVAAAGESAPLGSDGVAEFVKESAAGGVFRLELKIAAEIRYPPHRRVHQLEASCPLELSLLSPASTEKVKCVLSMHE